MWRRASAAVRATARACGRRLASVRHLRARAPGNGPRPRRISTAVAPVRVAVIGYGRMGEIHAANTAAHPAAELRGIVARNKQAAANLAARMSVPTLELSDCLAGDVDAVVVASATDAHYDQVKSCLQAGKAVLCEKPLALSQAHIEELFATAEKADVPLVVAFNRRFDRSFIRVRELIQSGAVGDVHMVRITSRDHPPPDVGVLSGGGSFFEDFSIHDIDTARWLVGEDVELVHARASSVLPNYKEAGLDDTAALILKFPSGAMAVIDNSRRSTYGYDVRVEVLGSKGRAQVLNPATTATEFAAEAGLVTDVLEYSFPERFQEAYTNEMDHFVRLIQEGVGAAVPSAALPFAASHPSKEDNVSARRVVEMADASRAAQDTFAPAAGSATSKDAWVPVTLPSSRDDGTIGVAVCGAGRMGAVRTAALNSRPDLARLDYVLDMEQQVAMDFAQRQERHTGQQCVGMHIEEFDRALEDPAVDAVVISTTSSSHTELIRQAAQAGKHIFVEKPVALSAADTIACVELTQQAGCLLYCGFQRRWDPSFSALAERVRSGVAGKVEHFRVTARDGVAHNSAAYLVSSGSYLYDSVIHDIDSARTIMQCEPYEVFCTGASHIPEVRESGGIDSIVLMLRFPNGGIATLDNHRRATYGYDQRYEAHTDKCVLQVENHATTSLVTGDASGFTVQPNIDGMSRYKDAYRQELVHFLELVKGQESQPAVDGLDCIQGALIADAAAESLAKGLPVKIPAYTPAFTS